MTALQVVVVTALALSISPALAQKPLVAPNLSLGDIPSVLERLAGCSEVKSMFGGKSIVCERPKPWIAVHETGRITIFFKAENLEINGSGMTLDDALSDLARRATKSSSQSKSLIEAIAPMLPTQ